MNDFKTETYRPSAGRRRLVVVAVIVVAAIAAIAVFAATGGLSEFIDGFSRGIHGATNGSTVTR